jgi:tetratricopeptide (TPR) repeat protein
VEDLSNPLFEYWKKLNLIQIKQADNSFLQSVQVSSNENQWSSRGIKLYCESRNEMAMMCFNRAGDKHRESWAKAASLRRSAKFMLDSNSKTAYDLINKAADIYTSIGRFNSAAQCFIESKQYEKAGQIYLKKCGDGSLEDAGDCFFIAGSHKLAAEAYGRGNYLGKFLSMCTSIGCSDPLFHYIQSCSTSDTEMGVIEHDFLSKCALHYHDLGDKKTMLKIIKFFHSVDSQRDFLKNLNCLDELLSLERASGSFTETVAMANEAGVKVNPNMKQSGKSSSSSGSDQNCQAKKFQLHQW